jgi:TetR/AcrR family transcriptional regulator, transcriptional repressor for nem operon
LQIVQNPQLSAIEKFQGFFDTLDRLRIEHKAEVISIGRVWYSDDNAIIRQKVDEAVIEMRAPLLSKIVHQGIQEGVFTASYPDQAGEVIMSLLQGMGNTHARLLRSFDQRRDDAFDAAQIEKIVATHEAYMDAIERILGVFSRAFYRANPEAVKFWVDALRESNPA